MNNGDFILIQAEMVSELGLSGNKLLVYALVHGFCKDGDHEFVGSIKYICDWTHLSKKTVISILRELVERDLLSKREYDVKSVKCCAYSMGSVKITPPVKKLHQGGSEEITPGGGVKTTPGGVKITPGGGEKITPNNYNIDSIEYKKEINKESSSSDFEKQFDAFRKKYKKYGGKARGLKTEFDELKKKHKDWKDIVPMLEYAIDEENKAREAANLRHEFFPQMKNLKTYINQRAWENYTEGWESYNPDEYHPHGYYVRDMDDKGYYLYIGPYPDMYMEDGYDKDSRPDGASLVLNNMRGTLTWNSADKKWELRK